MKRLIFLIPIVVVLLIDMTTASAQRGDNSSASPSGYELSWYTIDGGGTMFSTSGSYSLGGTIGQPDAGVMNDGSYTLIGGFWSGAAINYNVYLPLVLKNK